MDRQATEIQMNIFKILTIKKKLFKQVCQLILDTSNNNKENICEWQDFFEKTLFYLKALRLYRPVFLENELAFPEDLFYLETDLLRVQNFILPHITAFVEN